VIATLESPSDGSRHKPTALFVASFDSTGQHPVLSWFPNPRILSDLALELL